MKELLSKLLTLSYEFLGVVLPGFVLSCGILIWLACLSALVAAWGFTPSSLLAHITWQHLLALWKTAGEVGIGVPAVIASYVLGQFLLLISRRNFAIGAGANLSTRQRICVALQFRIAKPAANFAEEVKPLFDIVAGKFADSPSAPLNWRQFYPVARCFLTNNYPASLVTTYQNKYTLHRSLTAAGVVLFWGSAIFLGLILLTWWRIGIHPYGFGMLGLLMAAFVIVVTFSSSFIEHWLMFGNSIVTETYSILASKKLNAP
jgi:hypothetical protein